MAKILVIEDDVDVRTSIEYVLRGAQHVVDLAVDGEEGSAFLETYEYDIVVLDWEMPKKNGLQVLQDFRKSGGKSPILVLTGRNDIDSKERGFEIGADDYLTKPFEKRELIARVQALLRRSVAAVDHVLRGSFIELDKTKYKVTKDGVEVNLLPKEFALLEFFMRNQNKVFDINALLARVWAADSEGSLAGVRSTLQRLRQKIDPEAKIIKTVHSVGYIFRSD